MQTKLEDGVGISRLREQLLLSCRDFHVFGQPCGKVRHPFCTIRALGEVRQFLQNDPDVEPSDEQTRQMIKSRGWELSEPVWSFTRRTDATPLTVYRVRPSAGADPGSKQD